MQKEYITTVTTQYAVNLVLSKPESLRKTIEKTNTVRVYENGCIGVAGSVGETDFDALEKQAVENLELKLPYPCKLPEKKIEKIDTTKKILNPDKFVQFVSDLMKKITEDSPDFIFSNKVIYLETEKTYRNSLGAELSYKGNDIDIGLAIKSKESANLFDLFYECEENSVDVDEIARDVKRLTEKYSTPVDIEPGKHPVMLSSFELVSSILPAFSIEAYASNASIFKGKLGEKIFADNFSMYFDRNPNEKYAIPFFDAEGEIADNYKRHLIRNGKFEALLGNKRQQELYKLPVAQNSGSAYDSIPSYSYGGLSFHTDDKSFAEITKEKTVFALVANGGDTTTEGDFATPVQFAYLVQNGQILGRLPDFQIYGNIFDILKTDYNCTIKKTFNNFGDGRDAYATLTKMTVQK